VADEPVRAGRSIGRPVEQVFADAIGAAVAQGGRGSAGAGDIDRLVAFNRKEKSAHGGGARVRAPAGRQHGWAGLYVAACVTRPGATVLAWGRPL